MKKSAVNIDFGVLAPAYRKLVRDKAKAAGSTIVYLEKGVLIEEEPISGRKVVLEAKAK